MKDRKSYQREYHKKYKRKPRTKAQKQKRLEGQRIRYALNPSRNARNVNFGKGAGDYFDKQLVLQKESCAICGISIDTKAHLDHDHTKVKSKSSSWRGILCPDCNKGLGFFKDNIDKLLKAVDYLKFWNKNNF